MPSILTSLAAAMPGMPAGSWWLAPLVLLLLGITAVTDGFKGRVPDAIIVPGLFVLVAIQGLLVDWNFAGKHLAFGFGFAIALYLVNQGWYLWRKHDGIGMGDAKWSALAVAAFGIGPGLIAWFLGAWVAVAWIAIAHALQKKIERVHFAPFLFFGLVAGIYYLRFR